MSATPALSAGEEWKRYWLLVFACSVGFSFHSVATYSIGLFMTPLSDEFGWSRAQISAGLSVAALLAIPLSPIVGAMIDRWGSRRLAIPGLVLTSVSIAAFGLASGSVTQWLGLWTGYAILSLGIKSTMWTAAISSMFSASRGMALAVTLSGTAVAQILSPPITNWLIDTYGWRQAFAWLGFGWGLPALVLCVLFLFDAHDRRRAAAKTGNPAPVGDLSGLSVAEAVRSRALWQVAISTLIIMVLTIGFIVHQVPILTEAGVSRERAAWLASLAGVAGITGKLFTGYLLDRFRANWIGGITMGVTALAFILLLEPFRSPTAIVIAMLVIGYSSGCKLQICAYLTSRYGGMKNFGKVFGVMSSLIAVGAGVGPVMAGAIHDIAGSYTPMVLAGIPASLVAGVLLLLLGPYPVWKSETATGAQPGSAAGLQRT
ncbi:MFS transporter [Haliea sp. E17]|uniref:MFS transporter n=1 Tax=Haliea sp. E17 TaxID=3401576 RepID=UPI003AAE4C4E